jgi:radical SAM superfamily enzyme YgiQ (UPF0313 family)
VFRNESGACEQTPRRPLITPLDRIPLPARDLLDMRGIYLQPRKAGFAKIGVYVSMLTSRGCPYSCAFCAPRKFWRKYRDLSADRVIEEIEFLLGRYRPDGIMLWDDLFIANRERLQAIVERAERERIPRRTQFCVFARANLLDEPTAQLLKRLHVTSAIFGLESGSERILRYLKKGAVNVADNYRALRLCKQYGMRTVATLIVGSPDETEEDLRQTYDLMRHPDLDEGIPCHLTPLPGTDVWEYARERGVVSNDFGWNYELLAGWGFHPKLIITQNVTPERLAHWYATMDAVAERQKRRARLKAVNLKYLFHPAMVRKVRANWRAYLNLPARRKP